MAGHRIAVYEGYEAPKALGGYGDDWMYNGHHKRRGRKSHKRHCKFGVAKTGKRKGHCLKHRRARKHR
jgi:hypothetical protein